MCVRVRGKEFAPFASPIPGWYDWMDGRIAKVLIVYKNSYRRNKNPLSLTSPPSGQR